MKKLALCVLTTITILFTGCAEPTTAITVNTFSQEVLTSYNFTEIATESVENEDGSITYTIVDATLATLKEEVSARLAQNVESFKTNIKHANAEIVLDIAFNQDATVLEGTVTDAFGATNALFYLMVQSYTDVVALQVLHGVEPVGVTLKLTDAVSGELVEETLTF